MVRKIRFPLEMENGIEVRSMEELRENFSILKVLDYLKTGRLLVWLRDRYLNDEADAVKGLDPEDPECARKLCEILAVPYEEVEELLKKDTERKEKLQKLKQYTDKEEYKALIDQTAFDQDDLYDLLDAGVKEICLCGERFSIPLSQPGITYTGINNPVAVIDSKKVVDWKKKQITLKNTVFDHEYQKVLEKAAANNIVICQEGKSLYKWNGFSETFDLFYEFDWSGMYDRKIAKAGNCVYFMRLKEPCTSDYEIVSMNLESKEITALCDLGQKEEYEILCARNQKLFLRSCSNKASSVLLLNLDNKEKELFELDIYVREILVDKNGENLYLRICYNPDRAQGVFRYDLETKKPHLILKEENMDAIDLINGCLVVWGKKAHVGYYYIYNTSNGKIKRYEGGCGETIYGLWEDDAAEYRLAKAGYTTLIDRYPLYRNDILHGQEIMCTVETEFKAARIFGDKIRVWKGYLYIMAVEDSNDGDGNGLGYEVNHIPPYRVRLSDYEIQQYNGKKYVKAAI